METLVSQRHRSPGELLLRNLVEDDKDDAPQRLLVHLGAIMRRSDLELEANDLRHALAHVVENLSVSTVVGGRQSPGRERAHHLAHQASPLLERRFLGSGGHLLGHCERSLHSLLEPDKVPNAHMRLGHVALVAADQPQKLGAQTETGGLAQGGLVLGIRQRYGDAVRRDEEREGRRVALFQVIPELGPGLDRVERREIDLEVLEEAFDKCHDVDTAVKRIGLLGTL